MQRVSKAWRWPLGGVAAAGAGSMFVPVGGMLWTHLLVSLGATSVLVRLAHREVPFPVALMQWRLGGDDPRVLRARALSAVACLPRGRVGVAVTRLQEVLPELTRVMGPDHPDTLSARRLSLQLRGETGGLPDRIAAMKALLSDVNRVLGPGHPDTLAGHYCVAEWLNQDGRTEEAEAAYLDVITTGTQELGPDHNITLMARSSLAILHYYGTAQDKPRAVEEMAAVVDGMERTLGPEHSSTAATRRLLTQWSSATTTDPTSS
ncbi:tetratricopeptide repeat protein [Streptomyces sp. NPDC005931]|uniref:tetratricopeptide repeat protein n=1 Tax=Streptomyces sp. NPDC005931 TaxID=3364737 RepID=UPI0036C4AB82